MTQRVGQRELGQMACQHPNHDPGAVCDGTLFIHSRCHPEAPTWSRYSQGLLTIECADCEKPIVEIRVA